MSYDSFAEYYDLIYARKKDDQDFYKRYCRKNYRVLEVGCGTGRLTFQLSEAVGYILGLDISKPLIAIAEKKHRNSYSHLNNIDFKCCNFLDYNSDERYDLIFFPFRTFNHFSSFEEQNKVLDKVFRNLNTDGVLVLDLFKQRYLLLADEKDVILERDLFINDSGIKQVKQRTIISKEIEKQVNHIRSEFFITLKTGEIEKAVLEYSLRYLFKFELILLLEKHGFIIKEFYSDFQGDKYQFAKEGMVVVCRKS